MKKKLNEAAVASELREGSAFFRDAAPVADTGEREQESQTVGHAVDRPIAPVADHSISPPAGQSTSQPTTPSTNQPEDQRSRFDTSAILGRPKAFYITAQQDQDLDVAVEKLAERLRGRANQKIDRSTVVRLLLEVSTLTDDATAGRLASQFVSRLVSQLTG